MPGSKGDVRLKGRVRVEAKLTTKKAYTLKEETLNKICGECEGLEEPALVLEFIDPHTQRSKSKWAIIQYDAYLSFVHNHPW